MNKPKKNKPRKESNVEILHECMVCGNKWSAKYPVKHCFGCGYDERVGDALKAIQRIKVRLVKCSDGKMRIPMKLKSVKGKNND